MGASVPYEVTVARLTTDSMTIYAVTADEARMIAEGMDGVEFVVSVGLEE